jgi:hypothetical protein
MGERAFRIIFRPNAVESAIKIHAVLSGFQGRCGLEGVVQILARGTSTGLAEMSGPFLTGELPDSTIIHRGCRVPIGFRATVGGGSRRSGIVWIA